VTPTIAHDERESRCMSACTTIHHARASSARESMVESLPKPTILMSEEIDDETALVRLFDRRYMYRS
jgi:hypothetical protein